jgi:hypothetical protein
MSKFSAESKLASNDLILKGFSKNRFGEKWKNAPFFVSMNKYLLYQHQLNRP